MIKQLENTPIPRDYYTGPVQRDPPVNMPTEQAPPPMPTPIYGGKDTTGPTTPVGPTFTATGTPVANTKPPTYTGPTTPGGPTYTGSPLPGVIPPDKNPPTTGPITPIGPPFTGSPAPGGTGSSGNFQGASLDGLDYARRVGNNELVANQLSQLMQTNGRYLRQASQRGIENAAARGMTNSTIAGGNAVRAAIDAALPIASADANAYRSAADQNAAEAFGRGRMGLEYSLRDQFANNETARTNWLQDQNFTREFNGTLAMLPITNSFEMLNYIMNAATQDPANFTPDVTSGMSNFFQQNMQDIMRRYFGGNVPTGG